MLEEFCDRLAGSPLSQNFQNLSWFVPTVQTVHILCIAVVMTSVGMLAFRLLGFAGRAQPLATMVSGFMPWIWGALAALLLTGALLTITEPSRELLNAAFQVKMLMVAVMTVTLGFLQHSLRGDPDFWSVSPLRRAAARAVGGVSLALVVTIIVAGRWIAYI